MVRTNIDRRKLPRDTIARRAADRVRVDADTVALLAALAAVESRIDDIRAGRIADDGMSFRFARRRAALCAHLYRLALIGCPELRTV
jgi:hypothetical protein